MSGTISGMPQSIVNWLSGITELKKITFMTEYPPQAKAVPLKNSIVSVGLKEVKITDIFRENEDGELVRDEYCRKADIHIVLGIHVPDSLGGSTCHDVFAKIVNFLTFSSDLNIVSSVCDHVTSDRNTESLVMNADIHIAAEFCPADETGHYFSSFIDKTFFCKSHMQDKTIHITDNEREKWNSPMITGTYLGSGTSTRKINFGFKPRFAVVCGLGCSPVGIDFDDKSGVGFFGCSIEDELGSNGVVCTSTGIEVRNGKNYKADNVYPLLNEIGITYFYYVVK